MNCVEDSETIEYSAIKVTETEMKQLYENLVSISQTNCKLNLDKNDHKTDQTLKSFESNGAREDPNAFNLHGKITDEEAGHMK